MTTEPRTEAGRALITDRDWSKRREWYGERIRAIEDEAARKERERIAAAVTDYREMHGACTCPNAQALLAAIADTGES